MLLNNLLFLTSRLMWFWDSEPCSPGSKAGWVSENCQQWQLGTSSKFDGATPDNDKLRASLSLYFWPAHSHQIRVGTTRTQENPREPKRTQENPRTFSQFRCLRIVRLGFHQSILPRHGRRGSLLSLEGFGMFWYEHPAGVFLQPQNFRLHHYPLVI